MNEINNSHPGLLAESSVAHQVSVVIPSKDGRETLRRALDSLVANASFICEVVIVFSNSPQAYRDFCEHELQGYQTYFAVRLLDSGSESNGAIARNVGIQAAQGEYVALLDDDDEWMPDKLATYFNFIREHSLSGEFVLFSTVIECNEDHTEASFYPAVRYRSQPIAEFILKMHGGAQTSALLLPTALAKRVGFDPKLIRHQDYDFCMRLEEAGANFYAIPKPLSYWYRRGSGLAKGTTFDYCVQWIKANQHRISRAAFVGYIEKELLECARTSGRAADYFKFLSRELTLGEQLGSIGRLVASVTRRLVCYHVLGSRKPSSAELLQSR